MSVHAGNRIFISYSHHDAAWLQRLHVHLKPLVRKNAIDIWDDTRIRPGMDWRREINQALSNTTMAVLLVSADFLASDFVIDNELPVLLDGAAQRGTRILSAIVSPCLYLHNPGLARYQSVNPPNRPLASMSAHEAEEVLVKLAALFISRGRGLMQQKILTIMENN